MAVRTEWKIYGCWSLLRMTRQSMEFLPSLVTMWDKFCSCLRPVTWGTGSSRTLQSLSKKLLSTTTRFFKKFNARSTIRTIGHRFTSRRMRHLDCTMPLLPVTPVIMFPSTLLSRFTRRAETLWPWTSTLRQLYEKLKRWWRSHNQM